MTTATATQQRPAGRPGPASPATRRPPGLGAAAGGAGRHVHGPARLLHRQRGPAVHPVRAARQPGRGAADHRRVRADVRDRDDHRRPPRRPVRAAADVHDRPGPVHADLRGLRAGARRRAADRRPGAAGRGRRADDPAGPGHHRHRLRRPAPGPRVRRLRPGHGLRRGTRPAARRRDHHGQRRRFWLARHLPDQRAGRADRAGAGPPGHPGVRRPRGPQQHRPTAALAASTWPAPPSPRPAWPPWWRR